MTPKIPLLIVTVGAALAFAVPAGSQNSRVGCLETTAACQPVGDRPSQKPKNQSVRPRIQPKLQGNGTWRSGSHLMY
jgi:hypothetical protein